jgi:hypothetical protein
MNSSRSISPPFRIDDRSGCGGAAAGGCWPGAAAAAATNILGCCDLLRWPAQPMQHGTISVLYKYRTLLLPKELAAGHVHETLLQQLLLLLLQVLLQAVALLLLLRCPWAVLGFKCTVDIKVFVLCLVWAACEARGHRHDPDCIVPGDLQLAVRMMTRTLMYMLKTVEAVV